MTEIRLFLACVAFMLVLVPVQAAIHGHDLWAGALFGLWGWMAVGAVRWSSR